MLDWKYAVVACVASTVVNAARSYVAATTPIPPSPTFDFTDTAAPLMPAPSPVDEIVPATDDVVSSVNSPQTPQMRDYVRNYTRVHHGGVVETQSTPAPIVIEQSVVACPTQARLVLFGGIRDSLVGNSEYVIRASQARAALDAVGTIGEDDVQTTANYPILSWVRHALFHKKHSTVHRAANKLHKRVKILKELKSQMLFHGSERPARPTNLQILSANELAKRVVRDAVDDDTITQKEAGWYKLALVKVYFIQDEDDTFLSCLANTAQSHCA